MSSELSAIYTNIQQVLDLRHKYLRVSLQGEQDNPKDDPSWNIYPPPPPPVWVEDPKQEHVPAQEAEGRKPGEDVGEDFELEKVEIPGEDEMEFRIDDKGVYQVYENKKGEYQAFDSFP